MILRRLIPRSFPLITRGTLHTQHGLVRSYNKRQLQVRWHSSTPPPLGKQNSSALPFFVGSVAICSALTGFAYLYSEFKKEENKKVEEEHREKMEKEGKKVTTKGKPLIGGPFTLIDTEGNTVTDKDFLGKWLFIYFGFTFCPDVCPEELEKITEIVETMDKTPGAPKIQPIFISVDPKRDTPELIKSYLTDFHPRFIGLTGSREQVKRATRSYRVYFSEGPDQAPGANEYIVDHSIVTFLVDPQGTFSQNFGQRYGVEEAVVKIVEKVNEFYERD